MNRTLLITLAAVLAALCGVCLWQWKREADFRAAIIDYHTRLETETKAHGETRQRLALLEAEVTRVTKLRDDTEAQYLKTLEELRALQLDWAARGLTIEALSRMVETAPAVENQSAAIARQNELLKSLTAERDTAIEKLNARTREFNALTEKYNKLIR